jgi:pimeloyl-ACP methyl ester carboxylesterase
MGSRDTQPNKRTQLTKLRAAPFTMVSSITPDEPRPNAGGQARTNVQATAPRRGRRRRWVWLAIPLGFLVFFYGTVGYWASGLMIGENPRWRGMKLGPRDLGLTGETVSFRSADGVPLKAWWLPASTVVRGTVIIAPGGDHTREVMLPRAVFLVRAGYNVLAVDLRGHGESGGRFISPGLVEQRDILAAIRYVRDRGDRSPIALLGVCLGGVASLYAAANSPEVQALVADSAFPSGIDVFRRFRDHFAGSSPGAGGRTGLLNGRTLFVRTLFAAAYLPGVVQSIVLTYYARTGVWLGFDLGSVLPAASRLTCPALIISGEADWIVPPVEARRILDAIPGHRKAFLSVPKASHDSTFSSAPELYQDTVIAFLEESLGR